MSIISTLLGWTGFSQLGMELVAFAVLATSVVSGVAIYNHHERSIGAQQQLAAVTDASDKAKAQAQRQIDALNTQYGTALKTIEDQYANDLKDAALQHDSDIGRLRGYEARYRSVNAALASATAASAPADARPNGLDPLGIVAVELASALRADDAALIECWRERDSLTGK